MSTYLDDATESASNLTNTNPIQSITPPSIESLPGLDREAWIHKPNIYRRLHRLLKELQPWGVLFTLVALAISLFAFWIDHDDRVHNRTHQAWSLLSQSGDGNNGKISALEYLNSEINLLGLSLKERENLDNIDFNQKFGGAHLERIDLQHASMKGTNFDTAKLKQSDFSQAILERVDLTRAHIYRSDFRLSNLEHAILKFAQPIDSCFQWANLKFADLTNVVFAGSDLSHANLHNATLTDAVWERVVISQTILSGADLSNAQRLTQHQLNQACGDDKTILPANYTIPPCYKATWYVGTREAHSRYHSQKVKFDDVKAIHATDIDPSTGCEIIR